MSQRPSSAYRKSSWFPLAGILAVLVSTVILRPTGLLERIPGIGPLFTSKGLVGVVAFLIFVAAFWVLLYVALRLLTFGRERRAIRLAEIASSARSPGHRPTVDPGTMLGQRMRLLTRPGPAGADDADAGAVLAARSEIDHARSEMSYLPARALVWALPALGFIGTAATMSDAIGGLADQGLTENLAGSVVEPLAGAFDITLFALGAAVVCHLLLTWTTAREQRLLLAVEEVVLDLFHATATAKKPAAAAPEPLTGPISELIDELRITRASLVQAAQAMSGVDLAPLGNLRQLDGLLPALQSVDARLGQIHGEISQDLVVSRQRLPLNGR